MVWLLQLLWKLNCSNNPKIFIMRNQIIGGALIAFLLLFIGGCLGERSLKEESVDEAMCFLRLDGTENQDSTYVFIRLNGDSVSGVHHWVPDLKDARRGVITGTKNGDTIDVVWNYTQEGISDTMRTVFLLEDGMLKQQPYAVTADGRQFLDENAEFEITYKPTACPKFE